MNNNKTINCMSGNIFPEAQKIKEELILFMKKHENNICAWQHGTFAKNNYNHYRLWEYSMAIAFTNPQPGQWILDVGGVNSLLSWYLASQGVNVVANDLSRTNIENAKQNNKYFRLTNIHNHLGDLEKIKISQKFDYVYSICVIEHIMEHVRLDKEKKRPKTYWYNNYTPSDEETKKENQFVKNMAMQICDGILVISFAFMPRKGNCGGNSYHMCASMRSEQDIINRIVIPSEMTIYDSIDTNLVQGHPPIGIVFLKKQ